MDKVLFGERLKNAREASGMSRKEMASRIGVKPGTVEKWEIGKMDPRANRLQTLASLLNVPLMWLIAGSQEVPDHSSGGNRESMMLQKIADLDTALDHLKSELDQLRQMVNAGE